VALVLSRKLWERRRELVEEKYSYIIIICIILSRKLWERWRELIEIPKQNSLSCDFVWLRYQGTDLFF
jgi:hypothetical protein